MAQVKLLKIGSTGIPYEFDSSADEITLVSFTVNGGGPVLSASGLDMNNTDVSDIQDLVMTAPSTGTINQTAGALIIDNIMAKERVNTLTTAADILFPVITDVAGQVDAFRLPALAGVPSATPTTSGEGFLVWDSSGNDLYVWDGSAWDNLNTVESAENVENIYIAEVGISARDVVYISSADNVSPAIATAEASSRAIGFATSTVIATANVGIRSDGILSGFTGLTPGGRYYLDAAVAGAIAATLPVGTGNIVVQAGYAKSATVLQIQFQTIGRRA